MQVSYTREASHSFRLHNFPINIHSISLDPDEDHMDSTVFEGLQEFITEMDESERDKFLNRTLKTICHFAKNLKLERPPRGLNFSLQQNVDAVEFEVKFVAW